MGIQRGLYRLESRREMTQEPRLVHDLQAAKLALACVHFENRFHQVIDVALRVDAARNRQAQQFVARLARRTSPSRSPPSARPRAGTAPPPAPGRETGGAGCAAACGRRRCRWRGRPAARRSARRGRRCGGPGTPSRRCGIPDNPDRAPPRGPRRSPPGRGPPVRRRWETLRSGSADPFPARPA